MASRPLPGACVRVVHSMRICVLQVSYEGSDFECPECDPPRDLSGLLPEHSFHHEFLKKTTTSRQIRELRRKGFDIYVNLCEAYQDADVPSVDVVWALEYFGLPFTGLDLAMCAVANAKHPTKFVAECEGISVPRHVLVDTPRDVVNACAHLKYPLFVKPNELGDSYGIDGDSLVRDPAALERRAVMLTEKYGSTLVEEYVDGREFSVLVCGNPDPAGRPLALLPAEFRFREGEGFKTYDMKWHQHRPECNVPCHDPLLAERLKDAACKVFSACSAVGYARMDFRLSEGNDLFFLECNFDCSIFYPEGFEGTADYILKFDGLGQAGFLRKIIEEGLARHARKTKCYAVRQSKTGYGVFARRGIATGEIVMRGEESPHRIVTRAHVERNWSQADKEVFYRYAYPLGEEVYAFWDRDPAEWAPQNHSCDPNTGFSGLDVVALRDINTGEELTIDYVTFCDQHMPPFDCQCGSPKCRGRITGWRGLFGA